MHDLVSVCYYNLFQRKVDSISCLHDYIALFFITFSFFAQLHKMQTAIVVTKVVRVPVPFRGLAFRSPHTVLKFSKSPYHDNHLPESIHTCTIDTL